MYNFYYTRVIIEIKRDKYIMVNVGFKLKSKLKGYYYARIIIIIINQRLWKNFIRFRSKVYKGLDFG